MLGDNRTPVGSGRFRDLPKTREEPWAGLVPLARREEGCVAYKHRGICWGGSRAACSAEAATENKLETYPSRQENSLPYYSFTPMFSCWRNACSNELVQPYKPLDRRRVAAEETAIKAKQAKGKNKQTALLSKRRARTTMKRAIPDYLLNHEGGNSSQKTLRWHRTERGLCEFPGRRARITLVGEVDTSDSCLVCLPAQNAGQSWKARQRAYHPDLST